MQSSKTLRYAPGLQALSDARNRLHSTADCLNSDVFCTLVSSATERTEDSAVELAELVDGQQLLAVLGRPFALRIELAPIDAGVNRDVCLRVSPVNVGLPVSDCGAEGGKQRDSVSKANSPRTGERDRGSISVASVFPATLQRRKEHGALSSTRSRVENKAPEETCFPEDAAKCAPRARSMGESAPSCIILIGRSKKKTHARARRRHLPVPEAHKGLKTRECHVKPRLPLECAQMLRIDAPDGETDPGRRENVIDMVRGSVLGAGHRGAKIPVFAAHLLVVLRG
uniref:Histone deacetylase SIR2 n=2 Tax=Steinernema glaseri TaxID=37863 RepID=A0A1I7ZF90_9BILA